MMEIRDIKFQPGFMQQETQDAWEENGESLKERFGPKERQEVTVERRPVRRAAALWNCIARLVLIVFAAIGALSLANPLLRGYLYSLLSQIWRSML